LRHCLCIHFVIILATLTLEDLDTSQCITTTYWPFHFWEGVIDPVHFLLALLLECIYICKGPYLPLGNQSLFNITN